MTDHAHSYPALAKRDRPVPCLTRKGGIALVLTVMLGGCASAPAERPQTLPVLPLADVVILGEQHDADAHQRIQQDTVRTLVSQQRLVAVVVEMADAGHHTTGLPTDASPEAVQRALDWDVDAWPWSAYGQVVMTAVHAGIKVAGGNLPRAAIKPTLNDPAWDDRLPAAAWAMQREAVREGHCGLLPDAVLHSMTRVQVARDTSLATSVRNQLQTGKTVLLITGDQHARKDVGVPAHLPNDKVTFTIRLDASGPRTDDAAAFDAVWPTAPAPATDHCAKLRARFQSPAR